MTAEYANALTAINKATVKFDAIRADYRNMKIGDAEFLAAKAEYEAAIPKFDEAYGEEANLPENNQCDCGEDTCVGLDCI